jgi:hypothetical protein
MTKLSVILTKLYHLEAATLEGHLLIELELQIKRKLIHQEEILILAHQYLKHQQGQKVLEGLEEVVGAEEKGQPLEVEELVVVDTGIL